MDRDVGMAEMKALILWAALLIGTTGTTKRFFGFLAPLKRSAADSWALLPGLGLGLLGYTVFIVGSAGFLNRQIFIGITAVLLAFGTRPFFGMAQNLFAAAGRFWRGSGFWDQSLFVLIFVVFGLTLCGALAPAIGQDELCYHLMQPKNYVRAHVVYEVPYSSNSLWPYLMHMLFTLGLLLEGDSLAKLFHYSTYVFTCLAIAAFLKREAGTKTALYGAAVYALTPVVFIQASFAYVDNALALYVFLAFYAFYYFLRERLMVWAALGGVFAGFAASVKLFGLLILPVVAAAFFYELIRRKDRLAVSKGLIIFTVAFFVSGSVWYLRSWALRGNPVYPFYPEFFGGHGWSDPTYLLHGGSRGWREFLLLPWQLTMRPHLFGGEQLGMMYLIALPALFLTRSRPVWLVSVIFFGAGYTLLWFRTDPNIRFFLPALTFFACAAGHWLNGVSQDNSKLWKSVVGSLLGAVFLIQSLFSVYHFKDAFFLLFHGDRGFYLRHKERSFFAAQTINRSLAPSDKILSVGEFRGFYFDNPFVLEADLYRMNRYADGMTSSGELAGFLKGEGFTHLLDTDIVPGPELSEPRYRLTRFLKEGDDKNNVFKEILRIESRGTRYVLYEIL